MTDTSVATVVTATAECGDSAAKSDLKPETVQLCMFAAPSTPAERFERTASYAKNPELYLKTQLGHEVFERQKHLFSLPGVVDADAYGTGKQKSHLETHVANLFGKKAGLFFITGVQAQLTALKIHCTRAGNPQVTWHISCHLETAEHRAYEELYGLSCKLLGSRSDSLPTVDEIKSVLDLPLKDRPAAMILELPNRELGCATYTFEELVEISTACKSANVVLHCDGARIWEIEPYYQATASKSFSDIAGLFDTVYVSFYKGLQGASGAMLLTNDETLIADAKVWQRRAGGNAFSLSYQTIDCERGFNENIATFARKRDKMIEVVSAVKEATKNEKAPDGQQIVQFIPDSATCCQIRTLFAGFNEKQLYAARDQIAEKTGIRVLERAWPKQTLDEKLAAERAGGKPEDTSKAPEHAKRYEVEWMLMSVTEKLETRVFVEGYVRLCDALLAGEPESSSET